MEITATLTVFFDTVFFLKMSTNSALAMCSHANITTLYDKTKTYFCEFYMMLIWENIASAEFVYILRKKTVSKKTVSVVVIFI